MASCKSSLVGSTNDIINFKNTTTYYQFYLSSSTPVVSYYLTNCMGLKSLNGKYTLSVRSDGNLILYDHENKKITWQSNTAQPSEGNVKLELAYYGQLKLYYTSVDGVTSTLWTSENIPNDNHPSMFLLSNTGILIIYDRITTTKIWSQLDAATDSTTVLAVKNATVSAVASVAASIAAIVARGNAMIPDGATQQDASIAYADAYVNKYVQELGNASVNISSASIVNDVAVTYSNAFGTSAALAYASYLGTGAAIAYSNKFGTQAGTGSAVSGSTGSAVSGSTGSAVSGSTGSVATSVATTTPTTTAKSTTKSTTTSSSGTTTPTTSTTTLLFEVSGACICVIGCVFVLISFMLIIQQNN